MWQKYILDLSRVMYEGWTLNIPLYIFVLHANRYKYEMEAVMSGFGQNLFYFESRNGLLVNKKLFIVLMTACFNAKSCSEMACCKYKIVQQLCYGRRFCKKNAQKDNLSQRFQ
jgi:hypothetical protein